VSDPFLGEVRMMAFGFAPPGWAQCNGQSMPVAQNPQLFSLLGTAYGGDGKTSFMLPDLIGQTALGSGAGPGRTARERGQSGGVAAVALTQQTVPAHGHQMKASATPADNAAPAANRALGRSVGQMAYAAPGTGSQPLADSVVSTIPSSSTPHNNLMPFCVLNYCIALQGIFPPRG
jgi:microcystin-dependent protein